uniref:Cysteine-rich receptor-like protein kinase 38 n=1 Tax=Aegilops tauschii TaxID=37682 RepID=M8C6G8_AEGTA
MENTAQRSGNEPSKLPYEFIKLITKDFSEELGHGTFGIVYKVAHVHVDNYASSYVMRRTHMRYAYEMDRLKARVKYWLTYPKWGLKHPNIVELVAFCNEIVEEPAEFQGQQITAGRVRTALCFEYVHNGGLNKFISDQYTGLGWSERYKIIRGVCEGLAYLRLEIENPIMHLDLKPENILLNKNMVAKIADFGISKLFGEENTKKTMSVIGTMGYWPPEYIKHQIISKEFDIFSLGVIIVKIMVGQENYNYIVETPARKSIKFFYEDDGDSSTLPSDINDITINSTPCSALELVEHNTLAIMDTVHTLNETETSFFPQSENGSDLKLLDSEDTELLHVQPRELCFPFMSSLEVLPRKKAMISCSLQLNNKENDRVAFMLVAKTPKRYLTRKPLCGIVPPRCVYTLSLTMPKQPPVTSSSDSGGDYFTLYTTLMSQYDLRDHDKDSISVKYHKLFEKAKLAGEEVHELKLRAICDQPAQGASSSDQVTN